MADMVLSIIIPTRNQARTLVPLLEALQRLKTPHGWTVEIVAGYYESHDHTLDVLQRNGIRIAYAPEVGPGAGRNAAAGLSRGDLLYFLDSDARPVGEDFLIRLVRIAGRLGGFGAFGGPILLPPEQRWNPVAVADHFACWFNWHERRPSQRTRLFQPSVSLVIPRAVYQSVGGFDDRIRVFEDYEMQRRILKRHLPIYFVREFPVTHCARGAPWRSWRHSWYWGGPFRETYLKKVPDYPLRFPLGSRLFALNVPGLYARRMRMVLRSAWHVSRWQTCYAFPFTAATVLAWVLAVAFGRGAPRPEQAAPV